MLKQSKAFPAFSLQDQNGAVRTLEEYAGAWLVVFFYPKDNTSGCTLEARTFSGLAKKFTALSTAVVGVSPDSVKSHAGFAAKQELEITLLSDPEHRLLEAVGVWQKKKLYGREYMGVERTTALIDPHGIVQAVWSTVKVPGHVEAVLASLEALQQ